MIVGMTRSAYCAVQGEDRLNKEIWQKKSRLPGKRLPAVILYYSTIVRSSTDVSMTNLTFRTITNTLDNNPLFEALKSDILPLFKKDLMQDS